MNPSTAFALVLVDELVRAGVREAVLSPGSRSAPLAFALHAADREGRLRLHVRIDERSAGFLAVGLAKVSGRPVPVVTTSGTATANLHPAVLEASHAHVPLLVLTADRPPELRGIGANQTIDQAELYGAAVRAYAEVGPPEERAGQVAHWRAEAARLAAVARGGGPVHLNLPLREPLVPDGDPAWVEPLDDGAPVAASDLATARPPAPDPLPWTERGVVVVADDDPEVARAAVALARGAGWPLLVEPTVPLPPESGDVLVPGAALLLGDGAFPAVHRPDLVLVVGRPTLTRGVLALVRSAAEHRVVDVRGTRPDPTRTARAFHPAVPSLGGPRAAGGASWLAAWRTAGARAAASVDALLDAEPVLTEPRIARDLVAALPAGALLFLGSSRPVRDVDAFASARSDVRLVANRGVAGIDGNVSTALGAALAHGGPAYALLGDLTFLHDANGLVLGPAEPRPDLCLVVVDNDGGGIFGLLEPGQEQHAAAFERVFGTPHGADLAALCAATRTPHRSVSSADQLHAALQPRAGVRVVEVRTDRAALPGLHTRIRDAVRAALT